MSTVEMLTQKEKELVALAASISSGCLACTTQHLESVRDSGATEAEVVGAMEIALDVRNAVTKMMAEAAQGNPNREYPVRARLGSMEQPIGDLVSLGAALACNSVAGSQYYLTTARAAGASTRQIRTAIGVARASREETEEKVDVTIETLTEPSQVKPGERPASGWQHVQTPKPKCCKEHREARGKS